METLLSAPVTALFTNKGMLFLTALTAVVFIVSAVLPGRIYNAVPVTAAFCGYTENRRRETNPSPRYRGVAPKVIP